MVAALPELITLGQYQGHWSTYVEALYQHYLKDIVNSGLVYQGLPIRCKFLPLCEDGRGFGFWHCISEGKHEETRTPDLIGGDV